MLPIFDGIDHIHVYVPDRDQAVIWYKETLGFEPMAEFTSWAVDGGPLTMASNDGSIHLALFERTTQPNRTTIALKVNGENFLRWQRHLSAVLAEEIKAVDHALSWSLYFSDPYGNPYEITSYDYQWIAEHIN